MNKVYHRMFHTTYYPGLASFHKGGNILETPIQLTVC